MLKDKLRHIKNFKSLRGQKIDSSQGVSNHKWLGALHKQKPGKDLCKESAEAKKGNYSIGYSLKLRWLFVIGCP